MTARAQVHHSRFVYTRITTKHKVMHCDTQWQWYHFRRAFQCCYNLFTVMWVDSVSLGPNTVVQLVTIYSATTGIILEAAFPSDSSCVLALEKTVHSFWGLIFLRSWSMNVSNLCFNLCPVLLLMEQLLRWWLWFANTFLSTLVRLYVFLFHRLLLSLCGVVGIDYSAHGFSLCTPPLTYNPSSTLCI